MAAKSSKSPAPALAEKPSIAIEVIKLKVSALNMRADEGADDGARDLEADLLANGQILPLFVMACAEPDGEFTHEVLDGRRRLFAFSALMAGDKLPMDFAARCVVCETPEEIAQGAIITNTERAEASHADYLLAVHRLLHQFNSVETIARILHVEPKQVRQAAKLGSLDKRFLDAYKRKLCALRELRDIARLKDPPRIEKLIAKVERGENIWSYDCRPDDDDMVTADSPFAQIAGIDAYLAAGGTIEQDIFGDYPDTIQDVALLRRLWTDAVRPVAQAFQDQGLRVIFQPDYVKPGDELAELPWQWKSESGEAIIAAAEEVLDQATGETKALDRDDFLRVMAETAHQRLTCWQLECAPLECKAIYIFNSRNQDARLRFQFFVDADELAAYFKAKEQAAQADKGDEDGDDHAPSVAPPVEVDTGGYSHDLHKTTTALCGDGLALSLAAMPAVAFDALLSQLFRNAAIDRYPEGDKALIGIAGKIRYGAGGFRTGAPLREELVAMLSDWRGDWQASGLPVFTWIAQMKGNEKGNLLATIVALNLSLTEPRTDDIRAQARAEAALIAKALNHYILEHWAPDEAFWRMHSKKQLLAFAAQIEGADVKALSKLKADALYPAFDELAAKTNFVPPALVLTDGAETGPSDDETLTTQGDNPGAETQPSEAAE